MCQLVSSNAVKRGFKSLKIIILSVILGLTACTPKPNVGDFDTARWQADRGGCKGDRKALLADFKAVKDGLKGVTADDVVSVLGKPDRQLLAERNQEYYLYFLEEGTHCIKESNESLAKSVAIRFNAVGLASEITFQEGQP